MVAPTLGYDEPVVEGGGHGGHGLDQRLVSMVSIGRGRQRAESAVVCEWCGEIGLLLKNRMVRALKLLSLRYLRYLSWKAKDAR